MTLVIEPNSGVLSLMPTIYEVWMQRALKARQGVHAMQKTADYCYQFKKPKEEKCIHVADFGR